MSDLRETCERCGEIVITREPGSITLALHVHIDDEYAALAAKDRAVDRRMARNFGLSITADELPAGSAFRRA